MLIAINTKQEYEAIEILKKDKIYLDFVKNNKSNNKILDINLSENILELASAGNLFGEKSMYFVKILSEESLGLFNQSVVSMCNESENLFIFWGNKKTFVDKCIEYKIKLLEKREVYKNIFPTELVNALQKKDKKNSWILFTRELESKNIEEVYGLFIWAYKNMMTVKSMKVFDEKSGIKEFQYKNVKKNIDGRKDVEGDYFKLVNLYAESRSKSLDLKASLEQWVLSL